MALAVACILIMPAFSMPDNRQDGKQNQWNDQKPMMQDGQDQCGCQKPMEQDNNQCGCQKPVKSMMGKDDKQNDQCGCQNSMKGQDEKQGKFDGKQNDQCGCQKSMGKDDKQMFNRPVKSMMGQMGEFGKQMCHRPIKSMMGNHGGIKAIIVTVKIIE